MFDNIKNAIKMLRGAKLLVKMEISEPQYEVKRRLKITVVSHSGTMADLYTTVFVMVPVSSEKTAMQQYEDFVRWYIDETSQNFILSTPNGNENTLIKRDSVKTFRITDDIITVPIEKEA